ncbi:hypothetical protein, partial [Tetragenococcus halophilus]|uniref:hypothetical protein n=1 Tax=Tetragenococcus halophilus TaxID=51669 RepID=UPI00295E8433
FDIFVLKHLFSPFILVSNLIIKETNAFLLYKKLVLLLIFLVTTLNIIDPEKSTQVFFVLLEATLPNLPPI